MTGSGRFPPVRIARAPGAPTRASHCLRDGCDTYVGRPSKWGNPYAQPGKRSQFKIIESIDPLGDYERHVLSTPALVAALPSLRGKVLGCWCVGLDDPIPASKAEERCHAQVLARLAGG